MSVELTAGIVRILKPDGATAGTGFVVHESGLIATCAYVVGLAGAGPGGSVLLAFPASGEQRRAGVEPSGWCAADREDVAILRLEGALPTAAAPLSLGNSLETRGHTGYTLGFPERFPEGAAGKCEIIERIALMGVPVLQIRSTEVTPGFSGAPVLDESTGRVVGMVTAIAMPDAHGRMAETAFLTPSETLQAACPELPLHPCVETVHEPALWNVPAFREDLFTGREDVFPELHERLQKGRRVALFGLPGVGKTATALAYAHRHRDDYTGVFWANADTREVLTNSFIEIARMLGLPEAAGSDLGLIVGAVKRWFGGSAGWLLILDNADDLGVVEEFLPGGRGHLLLTTRVSNPVRIAQPLRLGGMGEEEGALLLLRRANRLPGDTALEAASAEDREAALAFCRLVGGLPLALEQAAAYIAATPTSSAEYLDLYEYQEYSARMRSERVEGEGEAGRRSVTTTFSLVFDEVGRSSPVAADLLRLCAFLAPDDIPEEILDLGGYYLGDHLRPVSDDEEARDRAIRSACRYSLLERNADARTLNIHRLVQDVIKDGMEEWTLRAWEERAVRAMNQAFPWPEFETWPLCGRLLPHALVCAGYIQEREMKFEQAGNLLRFLGDYLMTYRAQYAEAELLLRRAIEILERSLGEEHPGVAVALSDLAEVYRAQGKYADVEPLLKRALAIDELTLGAEHPETATPLNNLAGLYEAQGKLAAAEPLYQRALAIREQSLGVEHPDTATSLNNIAGLYRAQGKLAAAELLYKRALAILEQSLGAEHPDTATTLNNLAGLCEAQGNYAEAEPLYQRALAIREQSLGAEHPDTATSLNNVAGLYRNQSRLADAELLLKRALIINEQALGAEHPETATTLNNLAVIYEAQGKLAAAELLYKRALAILEQSLGAEHPDTASTLNNLAGLYQAQGNYAEAEPLYQRALAIREQSLGAEHPDTATSLNNIAGLYRAQGKLAAAEPLFKRAVSICEQALREEHPDTATVLANYAGLLREMNRNEEAEALEARAEAIREANAPSAPQS